MAARSRIGRARAAVPLRDDLGQDRQGGLGRLTATEVEPDRARSRRVLLVDAGLEQPRRRSACVFRDPTAPT